MNKLKAMVNFEEREIDNNFKELQKIVGGNFEVPFISKVLQDKKIDVYINGEGKLMELDPTFVIVDKEGQVVDVLVGDVVFLSHEDNGDSKGLSNEQIDFIKSLDLGIIQSPSKHYTVGVIPLESNE